MSYLDDLKKKAQGVVNTVQNAYNNVTNKAQNVVNEVQNRAQNVYNAATGQTPQQAQTPQAQIPNTNPSPATQPQNPQPETNWAAEYDKVMSGGQTPTNAGGGTVQGTQPPVSNAAQSALGEGAGQWQAELDNVMAQIMGKGKFDYNMNGDAMYQQYADIYQNQANLGMQNAMAQAAALTGGYGSSYGQMVGQQAYAQQMQGLNDIGLELYDRAYAQDMAERSQLMDQYNMLAAREGQAYNRAYQEGRDKVADDQWDKQYNWQAEEFDKLYGEGGYYTTEAQKDREHQSSESQKNRDHDKTMQESSQNFQSEENKKDREHQASENQLNREHDSAESKLDREHQASENKLNREHDSAENKLNREHDEKMQNDAQTHQSEMATQEHNWQAEEFDKLYGYTDENGVYHKGYYETAADTEYNRMYGDFEKNADGSYKLDENGNKIGGGFYTQQNAQSQENWQKEYDREGEWYADAQEASKTTTTYAGKSNYIGNDTEVPKQLAGVDGLTTTNTALFDDNGYFKQAAVVGASDIEGNGTESIAVGKGTMTYSIGGKEVKVQTGTNPYTNTVNPDANKGVMSNGYQPDNVGGAKLAETDYEYPVNGQYVPVYKTSSGTEYVYDAANNKYLELPSDKMGTVNSNTGNLSGKVNPNFSLAIK